MKTRKRTRFLSALLVVVMVITLLPMAALADGSYTANLVSASELKTGDKVVIYNAAYGKAMDASETSGFYNAGVNVTASAGTMSFSDDSIVWEVTVNDDGTYYFSQNGKKLSMDTSYSSMPYDKVNDKWTLQTADGGYYIKNVGRKVYVEWYNSKNNFSGYDTIATGSEGLFCHTFYLVKESSPVDPPTPTETPDGDIDPKCSVYQKVDVPQAGDKVIIFNAGNGKALSAEVNGYCQAGFATEEVSSNTLAIDASKASALEWVVDENDGVYTFSQGSKMLSDYTSESGGKTYQNISTDASKDTGWKLETCNAANHSFVIYNATIEGDYGHVYLEWYAKKDGFSAYDTSASSATEQNFGMSFYKLVKQCEIIPAGDLPADGDQVVIYNAEAQGVFGMPNDMNNALEYVPASISNGAALPENGASVFTVGVSGNEYTFCSGGKYLASNNDEDIFLTDDASANIKWTLEKGSNGYVIYSKDSVYTFSGGGTAKVCIEFFSGSFSGWSYKAADKAIFEMAFYPVADGCKIYNGVVNNPAVNFNSENTVAKGVDYELKFTVSDLADITDITIGADYGTGSDTYENYTVDGKDYSVSVNNALLSESNSVKFSVKAKDAAGNEFAADYTVTVLDEPTIASVSPANGSETGDEKSPEITATVINAGENPTVVLKLNNETVAAEYNDGIVSYTPAKPMADGRVNASLTVTRADGKEVSKNWFFNVGAAQYQLYFGQLHSHTGEYSDGSGTLSDALNYVKNLPDSANVDFVAFTDHSNYFDASGSANPEAALYDMSQATAASQEKWKNYKETVEKFNTANAGDIVAVAGFEMTWSGGPGHINTFNSPGIVSRNNSTLNNKTSDAGMKAYYALLSQAEGANTISQFNHPGSTFGTFSDFSYWDATIDSRVFLVEVGNGEGQVGAGGYYPSYEYYIMALDKGWHVAPSNNQDNHKGKWGNANDARDVILTDDFSEEGLYSAMRDMRVYSTEDKNLELHYTVNGMQLGSQISERPEKLDLSVQLHDPDKSDSISKVEVVVNSGKTVYTWDKASELASGDLSVTLNPDYSYYFIRVTEGDGDLAVTAPVWVGESLKLGISEVACSTSTPVTGEELELTTTFFNSEASQAVVKSITYTTDGSVVLGTDAEGLTIAPSTNGTASFKFTPDKAKLMTVTVTAVVEQDGKEYTFTKDITLDILNADDLVYIGIDASHYNEYVAGNYKDSMGNFGKLAAGYSVRTVQLNSSEDLIAACSNDKYKALVLTAPSRRLAAAQANPASYSAEEIAAINAFNAKGGVVILAGWSDYYENYAPITGNPDIKHMSETQNEVLAALGSSLRINDDATNDDSLNGGQAQRLYFSSYNFDSFLLNGVEADENHLNDNLYTERYSQYGGCSIYAVDAQGEPTATLADGVTPIVFGHGSTYTKDSDADGKVDMKYSFADGDNRVLVLASEQLEGRGLIIVSGAAFMSNFEVQATVADSGSEKNYSNYKMCENLCQYINPVQVTDIATVQQQTETGLKYTIEGVVTSNASGYDKDTAFFDCIYVQDETAGICCFPVAGNYKVGDKVRITGTTDFYQGEAELQVTDIKLVGEGEVAAEEVSAAQINDLSVLGSFVSISGTVAEIGYENGLVQTIMVKDAKGELARVFIDGYITKGTKIANLDVGANITACGLASYDNTFNAPDGPFPRIRVKDRADIVCSAAHVCPFDDIINSAHHTNIETAFERGYVSGYGEGKYAPDETVTRAQFITMLWRAAGKPAPASTDLTFTDIGADDYCREAIAWGVEKGIVSGYNANIFGRNDSVTRGQATTFIARYCDKVVGMTLDTSDYGFLDINDANVNFIPKINAMANAGIILGYGTTCGPNDKATRGQIASILVRAMDTIG